jgi:hypothetical protein
METEFCEFFCRRFLSLFATDTTKVDTSIQILYRCEKSREFIIVLCRRFEVHPCHSSLIFDHCHDL